MADTTLESEWVREEIRHASNLRKTLVPVFQESYIKPAEPYPDFMDYLLKSNGVTVLDKRNIYIDAAIDTLATMVLRLQQAQSDKSQNKSLSLTTNTTLLTSVERTALPTSLPKGLTRVVIQLDLAAPEFDPNKFLALIAGLTSIGVNEVHLVSTQVGSVIVNLNMPEQAANKLSSIFERQRELFFEFRPVSLQLVKNGNTARDAMLHEAEKFKHVQPLDLSTQKFFEERERELASKGWERKFAPVIVPVIAISLFLIIRLLLGDAIISLICALIVTYPTYLILAGLITR